MLSLRPYQTNNNNNNNNNNTHIIQYIILSYIVLTLLVSFTLAPNANNTLTTLF